jgi:uncharacterized membrane protein YraQ (UPF0718 family)
MNISLLVYSGLEAIYDYVLAHTLFCLVPAFFIAGAMAALIPKDLLLPYLGKKSPKHVAYPIAVVTGLLLAVCSCTVLPLFAGIRKGGAGIGPAIAFLYTAPATNIVAVLYTGSLIGWDVAFARIFFSILFAVIIGIIINGLFRDDDGSNAADTFAKSDTKYDTRRLFYFFSALIGILLAGTRISDPTLKYATVAVLIAISIVITKKYFTKDEVNNWMLESWGFAKTIAPLLLAGVFVSGIVKVILPQEFVAKYVGSNSLPTCLFRSSSECSCISRHSLRCRWQRCSSISAWQKARYWPISCPIRYFRFPAFWLSARSWGQRGPQSMQALSLS